MTVTDIRRAAAAAGLSVTLRTEQKAEWEEAALRCPYVPVVYTNASLDYQLAYRQGAGGEWKDISVIIHWNSRPAAVWPMFLAEVESQTRLGPIDTPILPPLFAAECPTASRKQIVASCLAAMNALATEAAVERWESADAFDDSFGLSTWYTRAKSQGARTSVQHELFLDLRPELPEIRRHLRKSYKPLITMGSRIWGVHALDSANDSIWRDFRALHARVAGRQTRSDETWALQLRDIANGDAFLVYLLDEAEAMVGGGLFSVSRDEGMYAVGAYDRTLFDKPLGHVVQYRAIAELKRRGVRWYKIGARAFPSDVPSPSAKELTIGDFKQGFASHVFPYYRLSHEVSVA